MNERNQSLGLHGSIETKSTAKIRKMPWYWRFTQRPSFWVSYYHGWLQVALAKLSRRMMGTIAITSELSVRVFRGNGIIEEYGSTSFKVVQDDFVALLVDALDTGASPTLDNFDYGGFGTDSGAEDQTDSALGAELTTEYATDNTRPTGTISQPAAYQYRMVVTLSPDASVTIEEFSPFSQAANSGGVMMDRSLTGSQALTSSDSLQVTYTLTFTAGS